MAMDYYQQWLGVTSSTRPPQAHELLRLPEGTLDQQQINQAARSQRKRLERYVNASNHEWVDASQRLMNEVAQARNEMLSRIPEHGQGSPHRPQSTPSTPTSQAMAPPRTQTTKMSVSSRRESLETSARESKRNLMVIGACATVVVVVAVAASLLVLLNLPGSIPEESSGITQIDKDERAPTTEPVTTGPAENTPVSVPESPVVVRKTINSQDAESMVMQMMKSVEEHFAKAGQDAEPDDLPVQVASTQPAHTQPADDMKSLELVASAESTVIHTQLTMSDVKLAAEIEWLAALEKKFKANPYDPQAWEEMGRLVSSRVPGKMLTNDLGMIFIAVPAGSYLRGSPEGEAGRDTSERQHRVNITQPFFAGKTEVTRRQWTQVMGTQPWEGSKDLPDGDQMPASHINWLDAMAFCERLGEMDGKKYRLPTEAEWEYICRAGSIYPYAFPWGQDRGEYASYMKRPGLPGDYPMSEAGSKQANGWGFHDMHGNVEEWCLGTVETYKGKTVTDPIVYNTRWKGVLRGGAWNNIEEYMRSATRKYARQDFISSSTGFRVIMVPDTDNDPIWKTQQKILASAKSIARKKIRNPFEKKGEKPAHDDYLVRADTNGLVLKKPPVSIAIDDHKRIYVVHEKVVLVVDERRKNVKVVKRDYLGYDTLHVEHDQLGERWIWSSSDFKLRAKLPMVIDYRSKRKDEVKDADLYAFSYHADDHLLFKDGEYHVEYRSNDKDYKSHLKVKVEGKATDAMAVYTDYIMAHVYQSKGKHKLVVGTFYHKEVKEWPLPDNVNDETPILKLAIDIQECYYQVADASGKKKNYRVDLRDGTVSLMNDISDFSVCYGLLGVNGSQATLTGHQVKMTHDLPIDLPIRKNAYETSMVIMASRQKGPDGFYHLKIVKMGRH